MNEKGGVKDLTMEDVELLLETVADTLRESLVNLQFTKRSPVYTGLNRFSKVCESINFGDLEPYFFEIYKNNRKGILSGEDEWIEDNIVIWFGKEIPQQKKKNCRLMISSAYNLACTLRENIENEELDDEDGKRADDEEDDSYYYADEILCYTLHCLKRSISDSEYAMDVPTLDKIIEEVETDIGVREARKPPTDGMLSGLLNSISEAMNSRGVTLGKTGELGDLSSLDFSSIFKMVDNEKIFDVVADTLKQLGEDGKIDPSGGGAKKTLQSIMNIMGPALEKLASGTPPDPPDGVTDMRSAEEKEADAQKMRKLASSIRDITQTLTDGGSTCTAEEEIANLKKEFLGQ